MISGNAGVILPHCTCFRPALCKDFESYFVQKIIEESKKTLDNEDEQGEYMQYFSDTLNQEYADIVTDNGGIGLAQQLYDSLKGTYNIK